MDEYLIEKLKQLRCAPCKSDRGVEKLAHVMWFLRDDEQEDEIALLPLCLACAKALFSRFNEPIDS